MRDEFRAIDLFERLKAWALEERPRLSDAFARRLENFAADHPIRYYKERLLAALTGANADAPGEWRELSRAARMAEEEPDSLRREVVAEDGPPLFARLKPGRRETMLRSLQAFAQFGPDSREAGRRLGQALRGCSRLEEGLRFVRTAFPGLRGLDVYRVLKAWDYPLLLPETRRQTLFYRLGLLRARATSETALRQAAELGESLSRMASEAPQTLDLLTGAFAGAESGLHKSLARCLPRPLCEQCPVSSHCDYFKFRRKTVEPRRPSIRQWDARQRPRERLEREGPARLSDAELLAILFRTGSATSSALDLAHATLRRFKGLKGVDEAALAELCAEKGLGSVKAVTVKAAIELGQRLVRDHEDPGEFIQTSRDVFLRFHRRLADLKQEQFHLLSLDTKHKVIRETMVSQGSLAASLVHPREAFKDAIRQSAASVIFVHNHPSGDPTPSGKDEEITRRLREAGLLLGIPMLDHVIVGRDRYYSFGDGREALGSIAADR